LSSTLNGEKPQSSVAPPLLGDVVGGRDQVAGHLLGRLHGRVERVDDPDEADLRHAVGVVAAVLADQPVDPLLVLLAGQLHEEVAGVHLEHRRQQLGVVDLGAVHRVHVAAGAGVHTDVAPLLRGEPVDHPVVELDELLEHHHRRADRLHPVFGTAVCRSMTNSSPSSGPTVN